MKTSAVTAVVFLWLAVSHAAADSTLRKVEFRLTDHFPGIDNFSRLDVSLESVALHRKGAKRREGWTTVIENTMPIDIVPLKNGAYQVLGTVEVPPGRYDAVRVSFDTLDGSLKEPGPDTLVAHEATVAVSLDLRREKSGWVLIDLYAEDQTEHETPLYEVKVKEIRTSR